jgi:hypothetical protein
MSTVEKEMNGNTGNKLIMTASKAQMMTIGTGNEYGNELIRWMCDAGCDEEMKPIKKIRHRKDLFYMSPKHAGCLSKLPVQCVLELSRGCVRASLE